MPAQKKKTPPKNHDRGKLTLEVIGVIIAAIALIYTIRTFSLEDSLGSPDVKILETSNLIPSDLILESASQSPLHRVYCNYYIRLSNRGGVDATIDEAITHIKYKKQSINLNMNDMHAGSDAIEDVLFTTYFKDNLPEAPKIPSREIEYIYPVLEVEVQDNLYDIEFITGWSNAIKENEEPIIINFSVHFINQSPVQTDEFYCAGLTPK